MVTEIRKAKTKRCHRSESGEHMGVCSSPEQCPVLSQRGQDHTSLLRGRSEWGKQGRAKRGQRDPRAVKGASVTKRPACICVRLLPMEGLRDNHNSYGGVKTRLLTRGTGWEGGLRWEEGEEEAKEKEKRKEDCPV